MFFFFFLFLFGARWCIELTYNPGSDDKYISLEQRSALAIDLSGIYRFFSLMGNDTVLDESALFLKYDTNAEWGSCEKSGFFFS